MEGVRTAESIDLMQIVQEAVSVPGVVLEEREIPSDVALVTPLVVRLVEKLATERCIDSTSLMRVELCLDEGITNAVVHGNRSQPQKPVRVFLWRDDDSWGVVIQDEGEGFGPDDLSPAASDESLWQEHGRGIPLMRLYMDEVSFYDGGRTLLMRQYQR